MIRFQLCHQVNVKLLFPSGGSCLPAPSTDRYLWKTSLAITLHTSFLRLLLCDYLHSLLICVCINCSPVLPFPVSLYRRQLTSSGGNWRPISLPLFFRNISDKFDHPLACCSGVLHRLIHTSEDDARLTPS